MLPRQLAALYPLLLAAVMWEATARAELVRPLFLPPLSTVLAAMPVLFRDGELAGPLLTSLLRAAGGLAIAMVIGLILGLAIARVRWAKLLFGPLVAFGAPAPKIALLPVFIAWFGIGHVSKVLLVAATAVFPFILAAQAGAEGVPLRQVWAARAMGTSGMALFRRVVLPAALPALLNGVRVAVPYALITAFTAEMIAGGGGLGGALVLAQRYFETPTVYADILVMLAVGYVVDLGLTRLARRIIPWYETTSM